MAKTLHLNGDDYCALRDAMPPRGPADMGAIRKLLGDEITNEIAYESLCGGRTNVVLSPNEPKPRLA